MLTKRESKRSGISQTPMTQVQLVSNESKVEGSAVSSSVATDLVWYDLSTIRPNTWNPNRMDLVTVEKLRRGIEDTLAKTGKIPPIVIRPTTNSSDKYQYEIIDGAHRHRICEEMGLTSIPAVVLTGLTDADAKILTDTFNNLRGVTDPVAYAKMLEEILSEKDWTYDELADRIPHTTEAIAELLECVSASYGTDLDQVEALLRGQDEDTVLYDATGKALGDDQKDGKRQAEPFVELKLRVPSSIAKLFYDHVEYVKRIVLDQMDLELFDFQALERILVVAMQADVQEYLGEDDD